MLKKKNALITHGPLVTVYILAFNFEKYVESSIQSVLHQTYKNWELIIINDGSIDGTDKIISKYEYNPKIIVVRQENKGLTVSCNIALRLSKGKYIMRLDGDDYLDEHAIWIMANHLEQNRSVGLVYPDYYLIDEFGEIQSVERRSKLEKEVKLFDMPAHGACTMFRKKLLLELGGYNEELTCQDGYDIWIKFIQHYKINNINIPLFFYRQHGTNLTKNKKRILETRRVLMRKYAVIKRQIRKKDSIRRVAIIPVRAHSDFCFRLALKKICGKPIIDYTLNETILSKSFHKIIVVSEDDEILEYVKNNYPKVIVIKRPFKYSYRNMLLEKTVQFVFDALRLDRDKYEEAMILYIEAPLRKKEHITKAIDTMHVFDTDSVISLTETISPYYVHGKHGMERIGNTECFRLERKNIYKGNGALLLIKTKNLNSGSRLEGEKRGHIIMLREDSVRLVSEFDFLMAEMLLKRNEMSETGKTS